MRLNIARHRRLNKATDDYWLARSHRFDHRSECAGDIVRIQKQAESCAPDLTSPRY
jgi:hypothetical protein